MKLIFKFVKKLASWMLLWVILTCLLIGLVANYYFPASFFILKFLLLSGIFSILIFTLKDYETFFRDFAGAGNDSVLNAEKLKLKKRVFASYNVIISLIVSVFFVAISIYLRFIDFNVTGFISLILLFVTVFISIIGYTLYIHLIIFLYRLTNSNIEKYSKFHPAYTGWLVEITKHMSVYQNSFFISGTFYLILFTVHAPNDSLNIFSFNAAYNSQIVVLLIAWIVIILALVVGFPLTSYLKNRMIRSIVTTLKIKSSEYYEAVLNRVEIGKQLDYIKIIKEIMESAEFPIKSRFNVIVASITSVINLIITIQKIYPQLFFK